jgi:hypothetical protein
MIDNHLTPSTMSTASERIASQLATNFAVLNICDVMEVIQTEDGRPHWETTYEWRMGKVAEFCAQHHLDLYERPRSEFYTWEGIQQADEAGYDGVILSDLS